MAADVVDPLPTTQVDRVTVTARLNAVTLAHDLVALEHHQCFGARANPRRHLGEIGLDDVIGVTRPRAEDRLLESVDAFARDRDGLDDRHTEQVLKQVAIDPHAAPASLVGHVERDDHALAHVHELQRQEQVAFGMHGIDDVDDYVAGEDDVARNGLLLVEGRDPIDARRVHDVDIAESAARQLYGGSREVGDVDVGAGQRIEDYRLADIRIAREDNGLDAFACSGAARLTVTQRVSAGLFGSAHRRLLERSDRTDEGYRLRGQRVDLIAPTHLDAFGERTAHGDLLAAASQNERTSRDAGHTLDARTFGHAETQRLHASVLVIDGDDLEMLARANAVQAARLARVQTACIHRALLAEHGSSSAISVC